MKGSIYMVFDYMDHDLTGLMEREGHRFTVPQVGSLAGFLFEHLPLICLQAAAACFSQTQHQAAEQHLAGLAEAF